MARYGRQAAGRQHYCDTNHPQRPCCWAARKAELDELDRRQQEMRARQAAGEMVPCVDCGAPVLIGTERRCGECIDRID